MTEVKEFEKLLEKFESNYYESNFAGQNINDAVFETFKKEILDLTIVYIRLVFLCNSLSKISKNSDKLLSEKESELLNLKLNCVNYAAKEINMILNYITDSLNA